MQKIKLTAKYVIGNVAGKHVVYQDGEVVYEGNKIIYVGKKYQGSVDKLWEQGLAIIAPGFIDLDASVDTDHALFDIALPESEHEQFKMGEKFRTQQPFSDEDFEVRHTYSLAQLIKNGVTTALPISGETFYYWNQTYDECQIMKKVAEHMGMRMYLGPSFKSSAAVGYPIDTIREQQSIDEAIRFCRQHPRNDEALINALVNPCQIQVTQLPVLKDMAKFARENKLPYRLHACETVKEWQYLYPLYGKTTIALLAEQEMLYNQFIIPHCLVATTEELQSLGANNVSVVSTPFADANFGSALFSFDKYQQFGINMTMGTDTQPADMLRNMKMALDLDRLFWQREVFENYTADGKVTSMLPNEQRYKKITAADIFNAATINGAKALNRSDIGQLSVGAKADIIVIDLNTISVGPYFDPIRTLLNACTGSNVRHTIINGKTVMKNREVVAINEAELVKKAQQVFDKFARLYEVYDEKERKLATLFPPSFEMK